ncbi:hypothetical protein GCM10023220_50430 [Streptomyces ziwulingensis]|uniref:Transposase IS4-like domain-containing protein n=1 Tax=Streptomyces ziwulingensis TaxID=1045501 RepID=A0ABP9CK41_9ACTN
MGRGKPSSKTHVLSDANGLPLRVGLSAAHTHDSRALKPRRLHADKAYGVPHLRRWLWGKRIGVRIDRKGIDSGERLGRRRWGIERTMSWLTGHRRGETRPVEGCGEGAAGGGATVTVVIPRSGHCQPQVLPASSAAPLPGRPPAPLRKEVHDAHARLPAAHARPRRNADMDH